MSVVIDTGEVPPGERFDLWADATPRVFEPLAVRPRGDTPFEGRVARHPLGPLTLYRLRADPSRVTRSRAMIGASDPEWVQVSLLLAGRCVVEQDGRRSVLCAGDFASWASSRPYAVDAHTQHDLLVTYCPEPLLRGSRISARTATTISGAQGAGALLRRYLRTLLADLGSASPPAPGLADGLLELVGALYDGTAVVPRAPDALRTLVRGHIDEHLGDPALDPESIAAAHFISRRHLDRLFVDGGRTVAETIRDRRLERCRRDLEDPRRAGDSVLDIAMRWGFVSPAHFSRVFRAAYGMAPREARHGTPGGSRPAAGTTLEAAAPPGRRRHP
jgi:AraC-like DNA-binding protein